MNASNEDMCVRIGLGWTKVYRLGGETDSAIRRRKRTSCDVGERPEETGC